MDSQSLSFIECALKFYFVSNENPPTSEELKFCLAKLLQFFDSDQVAQWISEKDCLQLTTTELTRKHIFLFDQFTGEAFDHLKQTEALILGPVCVLHCLHNMCEIPNVPSPVYSCAMANMIVCTSGLSKAEKDKIGTLVGYMGGFYIKDALISGVTHLVCNTVMSKKYEKAAIAKMRIMKPSWVAAVWKACQTENVLAETFEEEHKVLPFQWLTITSSRLPTAQRDSIKQLIEENGGKYMGSFKNELTDIVIMERNQTHSDKYKAAIACKKECLVPTWIVDSVEQKSALPVEQYRIISKSKILPSTPNKLSTEKSNESMFLANCTNVSNITISSVNESVYSGFSGRSSNQEPSDKKESHGNETSYKTVFNAILLENVQRAGPFLDGCSIFPIGFTAKEQEKLNRILNIGGAIRFQEYNTNVSHIIIGAPNSTELAELKSIKTFVKIVKLDWLLASILAKCPATETNYVYSLKLEHSDDIAAAPSPATKKNIDSMLSLTFRRPPVPRRLNLDTENIEAAEKEDNFLEQYLENQPNNPESVDNTIKNVTASKAVKENEPSFTVPEQEQTVSSIQTSTETENLTFLDGLTVAISGFTETHIKNIQKQCEYAGAKIVPDTFTDSVIDYLIAPADIYTLDQINVKAKYTINEYWLIDAVETNTIVDIKYYHHPIIISEDITPLSGMVLVTSIYSGNERDYIHHLGEALGATLDARYVRNLKPLLICPLPEGSKYVGAIKWNLPVVTCAWLLACLEQKRKVPLSPYLVGDSKAPAEEEPIEDESLGIRIPLQSVDEISNLTLEDKTDKTGVNLPSVVKNPSPKPSSIDIENVASVSKPKEINQNENESPVNTMEKPMTPFGRFRRFSDIMGSAAKNSPILSQLSQSPHTADDNVYRQKFLADMPTPLRQFTADVLKEMDERETPETKRRRRMMASPFRIPEECTTPYMEKQRWEYAQSSYIPPKPVAPITPEDEYFRRHLKKCLGDQYQSPREQYPSLLIRDSDLLTSSSTNTTTNEQPMESCSVADVHIRRLSEFIENRNKAKAENKTIELPETVTQAEDPVDINTEFGDEIEWRDPSDFFESERFTTNTKSSSEKYIFIISCSTELKEKLAQQIIDLKGVMSNDSERLNFTHLICEKPNRGEKVFSAIAGGKWILTTKYIEDSTVAGHFLDEEAYEWGNPNTVDTSPLEQSTKSIACAAYRWRRKLNDASKKAKKRVGVFDGFNVILHCPKKDSFKTLVEAGGGTVMDVNEPYTDLGDSLKSATHCIVDTRKTRLSKNDQKALQAAQVLCVNLSYLQSYITSELVPDPKQFLLQ